MNAAVEKSVRRMNVGLAQQTMEWQRLKRSGGWPVNERKEGKGEEWVLFSVLARFEGSSTGGQVSRGYSGKKRSNLD